MRSPFLMGSMAKTPLPWIGDRRASILCLLVLGMPERRRKGSALSRTTRADANPACRNGFNRKFSTRWVQDDTAVGAALAANAFCACGRGRGIGKAVAARAAPTGLAGLA